MSPQKYPLQAPDIPAMLKVFEQVGEHVMGEPFDRHFRRWICNPKRPSPIWRIEIEFADKLKKITLDKLQKLAYAASVSFHSETECEEGVSYDGCTFTDPESYGVYTLQDEDDVTYIADDVYSAQSLIRKVLADPEIWPQIRFIELRKEINADPLRQISIFWLYGEWNMYFTPKCKRYGIMVRDVFQKMGEVLLE